jgi:predicted AAA+ superfamily ATPase
MALTNRERLERALTLLRTGLATFVEEALRADSTTEPTVRARSFIGSAGGLGTTGHISTWDVAALTGLISAGDAWFNVFKDRVSVGTRSFIFEARDWRNKWAHQSVVNGDDTERALDTIERILSDIGAIEAAEVEQMRLDLRRLRVEEERRSQGRRLGGTAVQVAAAGNLPPWREVIVPHADVANGQYELAEFAADLWQVHAGKARAEYQDSREFFRRTYMTEGLQALLGSVAARLAGTGGHPVINLKTNFGGGKTHAMLAAYHLCSGVPVAELPNVAEVLHGQEVPPARRVVLVGTRISAGNPSTKPDGTVVRTMWGELAWQLGGAPAYARVAADDASGTSPGDTLQGLLNDFGPSLIMVDEWVAYARQLPDRDSERRVVGGDFETQFTFAQTLTEAARVARACALLISLPASDGAQTPSGDRFETVDDVEVGGLRGRTALARLGNVVGRSAEDWKPASNDESFEIVRRRLFEPIASDRMPARDLACRAFADTYRNDRTDTFPLECRDDAYERRLRAAYPIHPEVFDRLYNDWSTLLKFQRTRGVLRLMASVIHALWRDGDRNAMIMPSLLPIDDTRVRNELTRYLEDRWAPIIDSDVDGTASVPAQIDVEEPRLGAATAARRVARTIYLGSAPSVGAANRGIEVRRVNLGIIVPGEVSGLFADALRRLEARSSYLYRDEARYWFSTRANLNSTAADRANQIGRDRDRMFEEIRGRVSKSLGGTGEFARVHAFPKTPADVPDEVEARLVVIGPEGPHLRDEAESEAIKEARRLLSSRGASPRQYQNTLVFLAADRPRLADLERSVATYLAWASIIKDKDSLNLDSQQARQAAEQQGIAERAVAHLLPQVFAWIIAPEQEDASKPVHFATQRLAGDGGLATRASVRLERDGALVPTLGGSVLRRRLDNVPLWRPAPDEPRRRDVEVDQLVKHFASYVYLERLTRPAVLLRAIEQAMQSPKWEDDGVAYASGYDASDGRYARLRLNEAVALDRTAGALVVHPEVALVQQRESQRAPVVSPVAGGGEASGTETVTRGEVGGSGLATETGGASTGVPVGVPIPVPARIAKKRRYHGSVQIDPARPIPQASKVADEVISLLHGAGARVRVTIEIEADFTDGAPEKIVRAVLENGRTLRFADSAFEEE